MRDKYLFEAYIWYSFVFKIPLIGIKSNARSSPACPAQCSQGIAKLVYHGAKDESYLSYNEPIQHGRVEEMPDWGMLGAHL